MKYSFFILWIFFSVAWQPTLIACDACGCGVSSYYLGIMPQFHNNFVGLRYRQSQYNSHFSNTTQSFTQKETYHITEIWARYYLHPRLQLLAFVPYNLHQQKTSQQTTQLQGIGDVMLLANYQLFNTATTCGIDSIQTKSAFQHNLLIGGGIKLPTARWQYADNDNYQNIPTNFMLGSGSFDMLLNATYTIRYQKWGLSNDISYKINTKNNNDYRFGNRLSGNSSLFYVQPIKKIVLMPHIGFYGEQSGSNLENGDRVRETGGYLLANTLGIDTYIRRFAIGINYQTPLLQQLNSGETVARQKLHLQISYLF